MLIRKKTLEKLSADIRKLIDGTDAEIRDNREGPWSIVKNDIHTLASLRNEQVANLQTERDAMRDTLANISHQLKTPLTSLNVMADLLENDITSDTPTAERQLEFLAHLKTGLTRLEWLASTLLTLARLDAGAIAFSPARVSADELIESALTPLHILLDIKNQRVEVHGGAEFFCDKRWTAEALTNIIKNASEHSPEGGVIRVVSGKNPMSTWLSVTDGGAGLSHTQMARLFIRFEGSGKEGGHGIGLPLALAILRGQNGDIEVRNNTNGGATFTMKFFD